ncbi:MAG: NnrS family protein, partial [Anaerolineae bacterium]
MSLFRDGPSSDAFAPLLFQGTMPLDTLPGSGISDEMAAAIEHAPRGEGIAWGIPFHVGDVVLLAKETVILQWTPVSLGWLVFMHTSDLRPLEPGPGGFYSPMRGQGQLGERAAEYVMLYEDGTEEIVPIARRHQIGAFQRRWGENCFQAVAHHKPHPIPAAHEQLTEPWGRSQTRASAADGGPWMNWLWAWENPHPEKALVGVRLQPVAGSVIVSAISGGDASAHPLRWHTRQIACLTLRLDVEGPAAVLHVGVAWLVAGYAVEGVHWLRTGAAPPAALHLVTVGGLCTLVLSIAIRVTRGHADRPLVLGIDGAVLIGLVQAAALLRASALFSPGATDLARTVPAVLLTLAFVGWLVRLAPLVRPTPLAFLSG